MKKLFASLKTVLKPPRLAQVHPLLLGSFARAEEEARRHNEVEIAIANFEVQKEALQRTLYLAYASFITSTLAVMVAIGALIVTIIR